MNLSGLNSFINAMSLVKTTGGNKIGTKSIPGGAFAPDTREALQILRIHQENQFDKGFITKYKAMLTNRLNRLTQELKDAYTALLYMSMTQEIGQGNTNNNAALNFRGQKIPGIDPWLHLGIGSDTEDGTVRDNIDSFNGQRYFGIPVEMRRFNIKGAAGNTVTNMRIAFRSEEKPPQDGGWMEDLGGVLGKNPPPFYFKQKVFEAATQVNTSAFFSTLNYLYNFNPRQLKYTYAYAYTGTTTEAVGRPRTLTDTLFNYRMLHEKDATSQDDKHKRLQWVSSKGEEGYLSEMDPESDDHKNYRKRKAHVTARGYGVTINNESGTYGKFSVAPGLQIISGTEFLSDGPHEIRENFVNHYQVLTQTIGFNTDGSGQIKYEAPDLIFSGVKQEIATTFSGTTIWESSGVDGTLDYVDINKNGTVEDDEIMPGGGKITSKFNSKFVNQVFRIERYNDYNIDANGDGLLDEGKWIMGNYVDPMGGGFELARREGLLRADAMSKGYVEYTSPKSWEVNASRAVPTDWYQAEIIDTTDTSKIWFPYISGTIYEDTSNSDYKDQVVNLRKTFDLSEGELRYILNRGLGFSIDVFTSEEAYLMINGEVVTNSSGQPIKITSSPSLNPLDISRYLRTGTNVIALQAITKNSGQNYVSVNVNSSIASTDAFLSNLIRDKVSTLPGDIKGKNKTRNKMLSFWQAQIVPYMDLNGRLPSQDGGAAWNSFWTNPSLYKEEAKNISSPMFTGTLIKRKPDGNYVNAFDMVLMEYLNDPRYRDVFRMGLFKDIAVIASANAPNGMVINGNLTLNYDLKTHQVIIIQDKYTAKQG